MTHTIHHGDCLDVLRSMPDNSVNAVVCDPPYGLSNTSPDKVTETIVRWAQGDREYVPQGKGFMGARWDAFVPPVAVWDECLRVLKPGGHLVAFAGSRTQDLMGLAIRLAGFDIRENLAWLYGSGFPKSLDVSKAIDKLNSKPLGKLREFGAYVKTARVEAGLTQADVNNAMDMPQGCGWWEGKGAGEKWDLHLPSIDTWAKLKTIVTTLEDDFDYLIEWAEAEREVIGVKWTRTANKLYGNGAGTNTETIETKPATPDAEKWQGWGTALKPAHEPIILARKPFPGTVAANTLTWGTGGLNIDATRIGTGEGVVTFDRETGDRSREQYRTGTVTGGAKPSGQGRWPANVVLDPDTAKALDQQSGTSKDGVAVNRNKTEGEHSGNTVYGARNKDTQADATYGGQGGASRFFKVADYSDIDLQNRATVADLAFEAMRARTSAKVVEPDPPFMYAAKAPKKERPTVKRAVLRLRDDLTPAQVDHVQARLREAGVKPL